MTLHRIADTGIIRQMRCLHAQAAATLNTLHPGVRVDFVTDNATLTLMWRSTQVTQVKKGRFTINLYNN
jgi:hypothetical protein